MGAKINLLTGKIIGAKRNSFEWFHEKGHAIYDNSELGITNGVRQNTALYCALLFMVCGYLFDIFKVFAGISVAYIIWLVIYEEIWCDRFAKKKLEESKKKSIRTKRFK